MYIITKKEREKKLIAIWQKKSQIQKVEDIQQKQTTEMITRESKSIYLFVESNLFWYFFTVTGTGEPHMTCSDTFAKIRVTVFQ